MPATFFKRFLLLLPLLIQVALAPATRAEEDVLDAMAAVVNGDVITFSQVREIVDNRVKSIRAQYPKGGKEYLNKVTQVRSGGAERSHRPAIDHPGVRQE